MKPLLSFSLLLFSTLLLSHTAEAQTWVARAAFTVGGEGEFALDSSVINGDIDFDDESGFGIDLIAFSSIRGNRLGLFAQFTPDRAFDLGNNNTYESIDHYDP